MKKVLTYLSLIIVLASCSVTSRDSVQVEPEAGIHLIVHPRYHYRYYRYYQPGYWTWRGSSRIYVGGRWYRVRHY